MTNLQTRAITGAIYVLAVLAAAWAGPATTFLLLLPLLIAGSLEFHALLWEEGTGPPRSWAAVMVGAVYTTASMAAFDAAWTIAATAGFAGFLFLLTVALGLRNGPGDPVRDVGGALVLILLLAMPFAALINLFAIHRWVYLGFMIMLWTNDTGAYLVGRSIGRTKLLPAVSPGKTVEGLIGGVFFTMAAGYALSLFQPVLDLGTWLVAGAVVALAGTLGDLLESAFKRARGVKDSGTLLPGHGGVLDRFDGALLAAPALLLYLHIAQ